MRKKKYDRPGRPSTHGLILCVETGEVFKTYAQAARSVGGTRWGVYLTAIGCQRHHRGFHFKLLTVPKMFDIFKGTIV